MTISELRIKFENELQGLYYQEEIKSFFSYVLSHVLEIPKLAILSHTDKKIDEKVLQEVDRIALELKKMVPLQYILGKTDFYGLILDVNPAVLIPRPETEELVDWIIKENKRKKVRILDVCTGSGCIALALKKNLPLAEISALDISTKALKVAKSNAHKLDLNIEFIEIDALKLDESLDPEKFDVIVSNPPYILPEEKATMKDNVLLYEPHEALFVPENDPFLFYKAIGAFAKKSKKPIILYFEINETKGNELSTLLKAMGFTNVVLRKDINGKDRMLKCTYLC